MANFEEAKVTLTNTPLKKLESTAKNKHVTSLYIFILLFLTFSKEVLYEIKKFFQLASHQKSQEKNDKISAIIIQTSTV